MDQNTNDLFKALNWCNNNNYTNIIILGAGSMGTAFSYPYSDNNHNVKIIGTHLENDFIDLINSKKKHPVLDCNIAKNVEFLKIQNSLD